MENAEIKVQVSKGNTALMEWKEAHNPNLNELINSLDRIKGSVNDFLTVLVNETKISNSSGKSKAENPEKENIDIDEDEDENIEEDPLVGVLKEIKKSDESISNSSENDKREYSSTNQAKRLKK